MMGNPEAQKRVNILFQTLVSSENLHENMTADELKIQIDMSCGICERITEGVIRDAVKRMKNRDWKKLSEWVNKHCRGR